MEHKYIIENLAHNREVFNSLLKDITEEEYMWRPAPGKWCLLEIVCHLYDEELDDFRARTMHVLETPSEPMPKTDPEGWVTQRKYIEQDYNEMLGKFLDERKKTVQILNDLESPKWDNAYEHPVRGALKAEMFLINWLAHDYLHIRQINALRYNYLKHISGEELDYAGNW